EQHRRYPASPQMRVVARIVGRILVWAIETAALIAKKLRFLKARQRHAEMTFEIAVKGCKSLLRHLVPMERNRCMPGVATPLIDDAPSPLAADRGGARRPLAHAAGQLTAERRVEKTTCYVQLREGRRRVG